jgi:hypothetical protein
VVLYDTTGVRCAHGRYAQNVGLEEGTRRTITRHPAVHEAITELEKLREKLREEQVGGRGAVGCVGAHGHGCGCAAGGVGTQGAGAGPR